MFRKSLIVAAMLVAAGSANADGFFFRRPHHVHVARPVVVRHYRPVYVAPRPIYIPRPVYVPAPVYVAPRPIYVSAPAPVVAPSAPVVNNITTNVSVQGDANTVSVGATAAQGSTAASSQIIWQEGMATGTTSNFKWLDPRTGRLMEVDVDDKTGIIEHIEED
jgi:hypothetical protein